MRVLAALVAVAAFASAASAAPAFGQPVGGLEIGLEVTDVARPTVAIVIRNVSDHPITLRSHIATHEKQYDWYTIQVTWPKAGLRRDHGRALREGGARHPLVKVCLPENATRTIGLSDDRDRAAPITVTLAAGAERRHAIDLGDWAARRVNGARALGGGTYDLAVTYRVAGERGVWNGTISSGHVALARKGPIADDMCEPAAP